jgi:endonuclease-3
MTHLNARPAAHANTMTKAMQVHDLLITEYGDPPWQSRADPLSELIGTILSQNTSDLNSGRAYASLRAAFPSWDGVRAAPLSQLADAIRCGGLADIKAARIHNVLNAIHAQRGRLDLSFLAALPVADARAWLLTLDGVGPKTAACVLMFSLCRPVIPVDTHVHRLAHRLGLSPASHAPEATQSDLEAQLPPETRYAFHMNLINHGRRVCKAQRPLCDQCALAVLCDYPSGRLGVPVAA